MTDRNPAVARVSIATLQAIEKAIAPGLTANQRRRRCVALRPIIAGLLETAKWNGEPLPEATQDHEKAEAA